jgi:hypothetical protein
MTASERMARSLTRDRNLSEEVTYTPAGGDAEVVRGIVSSPTRLADVWPGMYVGVKLLVADLSQTPVRGDTVTVQGTTYTVFDVQVTTIGTVKLALEKA